MLLNVGSGGGAAAVPSGGPSGGPAADGADEEDKKEEKEEGKLRHIQSRTWALTSSQQRKRNRTKIWASDSLTKSSFAIDLSFGGVISMPGTSARMHRFFLLTNLEFNPNTLEMLEFFGDLSLHHQVNLFPLKTLMVKTS